MLEIVRSNLESITTDYARKKFLLAVSGGVDSVVLAELFYQLKLDFVVAHCNFKLRGKESDEDEEFVKSLAESLRVRFYLKRFNTEEELSSKSGSLQQVARELRFNWFEGVRRENGIDYIVTAAHDDDQVETILINMLRGTGLSGIHGIRLVSGRILHPLMGASKAQIKEYAKKNELHFREDSSNTSTKYLRNKLRQEVVPILKEINPSLSSIFAQNAERFSAIESIYYREIERQRVACLIRSNDREVYNMNLVRLLDSPETYLFEFLRYQGFSFDRCSDILRSNEPSGKEFLSPTHRAVLDRDNLIVVERKSFGFEPIAITTKKGVLQEGQKLRWETISAKQFKLDASPRVAQLDADKLQDPLLVRSWMEGDRMVPLGMKGSKKVSDILVDEKVSIVDKERTLVLTSNDKIAWLVGRKISEDFKVDKNTKSVFEISKVE